VQTDITIFWNNKVFYDNISLVAMDASGCDHFFGLGTHR